MPSVPPVAVALAVVALALLVTACGGAGSTPSASPSATTASERSFAPAPAAPDGALSISTVADLDLLFASLGESPDIAAVERIGAVGDPRLAWLMADLLRFAQPGALQVAAGAAWQELTGVTIEADQQSPWGFVTDHLIAWDTPAPPGYLGWKRQLFELVEPGWAPLFDDPEATVDWRWVSWGGVLIDDRPLDQVDAPCPRGCIPALDDPPLTDATEGDWYDDDATVFGVVVADQAVAFPKNIMEVHEMVNLDIGDRRLGIPYCTLCGSAQAYLTDEVSPEVDLAGPTTYELRTSGLLSRSNKVMFELHTMSLFDTFTGEAVAGPLRAAGVTLEQVTVRTSTWGEWKQAHPRTRIVARDGGIGRDYPDDPLQGRDDDGPIFPIGDADGRLGVHEPVVGVVAADGTPVAFTVAATEAALARNDRVEDGGVSLTTDGAGFVAVDQASGDPLATHQAFWFAWSQFHPGTRLWAG